ncbi:MAG: PAS domain S-box protein, partial [Thermoleophilia bacterium]|nr:PAS domain S-box protein [Thermoleophilia bacterium]
MAGLTVIVLGVVAFGVWAYQAQVAAAHHAAEERLTAIAESKAREIERWLSDRLADAGAIADNPELAQLVQGWITTRASAARQAILAWFSGLQRYEDYANVRLVAPDGQVLLSLDPADSFLAPEAAAAVRTAMEERRPILTDLHQATTGEHIHQDAIAPLILGPDTIRPVAAVVMTTEADQFLFPLIQSWPTASKSGETLLVRPEGDRVLFLNDLRFQKDAALKLSFPLTRTELPAVQAVLQLRPVVEGPDYRGVEVIAALKKIANFPWYLVAKQDRSEALAGVGLRAGSLLALTLVLAVAVPSSVWANWQWRLKRRYRAAYEAEVQHRALLQRFALLVRQANEAIFLINDEGAILEANDRALEMYGYSRAELLRMQLPDILAPEMYAQYLERRAELSAKGALVFESVHRRKDGSTFPVEISTRQFELDGSPCMQVLVRDISERKRAEEEKQELERRLQQSQRLESLGVMAGGIAHDFNNILMAVLGYADLALMDLPSGSPARASVQEIILAARKAAELCRQMLAYSGRGQFVIETVDI